MRKWWVFYDDYGESWACAARDGADAVRLHGWLEYVLGKPARVREISEDRKRRKQYGWTRGMRPEL